MKKVFAILLALTAVGVVMSGCSGDSGGGDTAAPADKPADKPAEGG